MFGVGLSKLGTDVVKDGAVTTAAVHCKKCMDSRGVGLICCVCRVVDDEMGDVS